MGKDHADEKDRYAWNAMDTEPRPFQYKGALSNYGEFHQVIRGMILLISFR